MSEHRTIKSLAERVEREFYRRGGRLRSARFKWAVMAAIGAVVLSAAAWVSWGKPIFQSRPVSTAHTLFGDQCQKCHTNSWATAGRLVTLGGSQVSTPDEACLACHTGPKHHDNEVNSVQRCVECHQEHLGHGTLARVPDAQCTRCHAELKTANATATFAAAVGRFEDHPEWAVLRGAGALVPARHGAALLVEPRTESSRRFGPTSGGAADGYEQRHPGRAYQDRTRLYFNHQVHLVPEGVLQNDHRTREVLDCGSCHAPDAQRRYLAPINYEQHCQRCHAGQLAPEVDEPASLPGFDNQPVPHEALPLALGAMRNRYAAFAPRAVAAGGASEGRLLPGESPERSAQQAEFEFVADRLRLLTGKLLTAGKSCRYCHAVELAAGPDPGPGATRRFFARDEPLPEPVVLNDLQIVDPRIPDRWLTHSVFNHDSHRLVGCVECHQDVGQSRWTEHVLLPGVAVCQKCHQQSGGSAGSSRADCVECHGYHPRAGESLDGRLKLDLQPADAKAARP